jgi:hypothetical protein
MDSKTSFSRAEGFGMEVRVPVRCGDKHALLHLPPRYAFGRKGTPLKSKPFVISGLHGARARHSTAQFEALAGSRLSRNWKKSFKIKLGDKWVSVDRWMATKKWRSAGRHAHSPESVLVAQSVFLLSAASVNETEHSPRHSQGMRAVLAHLRGLGFCVMHYDSVPLYDALTSVLRTMGNDQEWGGLKLRGPNWKRNVDNAVFEEAVAAMRQLLWRVPTEHAVKLCASL